MKKFAIFTEIAAINKASQVIRKVVRDLKPMAAAARGVNRAWKRTSQTGGDLLRNMRNIGLVAITAAGAVLGFSKKSASSAAKIRDAADKLGISTDEFQEYIFVADQAGIASQNLETGLQRLNRRIADAAGGKNKELAALFVKLKIPLRDVNGNLRTSADLMPELADAFKANANAAIRTKIAFALFDTEGVDFLRFLSKGRDALLAQMRAARQYGQVVREDTLRSTADLEDRFGGLSGAVRSLGIEMTARLAPGLKDAVTAFQGFLADGTRKEKLLAGIAAAAAATKAAMGGFTEAVSGALPVIQGIVDALGGWENVGLAVATLVGVKLVASVAIFAASLGGLAKALAVLAFSNPFTAIAAAVAIAAVTIIANWDNIAAAGRATWEAVASAGASAWGGMAAMVSRVFGAIKATVAGGTLFIVEKIKSIVSALPDFVTARLGLDTAGLARTIESLRGIQAQGLAARGQGGAANRIAHPLMASQAKGEVTVRFENAPRGVRARIDRAQGMDLSTDVGHSLAGTGP